MTAFHYGLAGALACAAMVSLSKREWGWVVALGTLSTLLFMGYR